MPKKLKPFDPHQSHLVYLYLQSAISGGQPLKQLLADLSADEDFSDFKERLQPGTEQDPIAYFKGKGLLPDSAVDLLLAARNQQSHGAVESALEALIKESKEFSLNQQNSVNSLFWPAALALMLLLLIFICMVFVVPSFKDVYTSFGGELPQATLILIEVAEILGYAWPILLGLLVAIIIGYKRALPFLHKGAMYWPLYRRFADMSFAYRALTWAQAVHTSPQLTSAAAEHLQQTASWSETKHAKELALSVKNYAGQAAFRGSVPHSLRGAFAVLDDKKREAAFLSASVIAGESSKHSLQRLSSIITLASYAVAGVATGFLLIALYLPIFKLGQVV